MRLIALIATLVLLVVLWTRASGTQGLAEPSFAPPQGLPQAALELLTAEPFVVDEPFVHEWRAEKPLVNAGYLLVLRAAPDLVRTRETYEPVLFVGAQTAERCSVQQSGGVIVALVPAPLGSDGHVALDLATTPIFFGSLELPERVDAARCARELADARRKGLGAPRRALDLRQDSEAIRARSREELQPYIDDLVARFSEG
jgi:hypothetical protein